MCLSAAFFALAALALELLSFRAHHPAAYGCRPGGESGRSSAALPLRSLSPPRGDAAAH